VTDSFKRRFKTKEQRENHCPVAGQKHFKYHYTYIVTALYVEETREQEKPTVLHVDHKYFQQHYSYTYIVTALYVDETRVQREKNIDLPQVTNTFNNITLYIYRNSFICG
jgi:hypothetical protein